MQLRLLDSKLLPAPENSWVIVKELKLSYQNMRM